MHRIVITGGAGFIGSHVADHLAKVYPDARIAVIDKMTYAADIDNLSSFFERGKRTLHVGDLSDFELCERVTAGADCVVNLAAESHVDNSFGNSLNFTRSNTLGTHTLLEACRVNKVPKIIHVSTDEVYGEIESGLHTEADALNPTNPYSASKAAADMIVNSYVHCFKMPIVSVRANNIYGIRQFPEKIIPRFSVLGMLGHQLTIHGDGSNRRRYLSAVDFAEAIEVLMTSGREGEIYNIGSEHEFTNLQISEMILSALGRNSKDAIVFVEDRPFNDCRYAIDSGKLRALGWVPRRPLEDHLPRVVDWYRDNLDRYQELFQRPEALVSSRSASA